MKCITSEKPTIKLKAVIQGKSLKFSPDIPLYEESINEDYQAKTLPKEDTSNSTKCQSNKYSFEPIRKKMKQSSSDGNNKKNHSMDDDKMQIIIKRNLEKCCKEIKKDYYLEIIDKIVYNEKAHMVAIFKDYLIYDDNNEFFEKLFPIKVCIILLENLNDITFHPNWEIAAPRYIVERANRRRKKIQKIKNEDAKKGIKQSMLFGKEYMINLAKEDLGNSKSIVPADSLEASIDNNCRISFLLNKLEENDTILLGNSKKTTKNNPKVKFNFKLKKVITRNCKQNINSLPYVNQEKYVIDFNSFISTHPLCLSPRKNYKNALSFSNLILTKGAKPDTLLKTKDSLFTLSGKKIAVSKIIRASSQGSIGISPGKNLKIKKDIYFGKIGRAHV